MRNPHKINLPQKQVGAALLLFVLLLVAGASTLLVSKLNKAAAQYYRDDVTMKALIKAKEALIGYAVSYPDIPLIPNPKIGPGALPCPDRNNDGDIGFSEYSCSISAGTGTFLGRLPWRFMGIDEIRDSSGQTLWYALSDNFRIPLSSFRVVNSETPGLLSLDSDGNGIGDDEDIVAVVIAPSEPVCDQNRVGATNEINSSNYLEDVNFDTTPDFITTGTTVGCNDNITFNDRMLPITRRELMATVEKRVLGEVANVLNQHRNVLENLLPNSGRFPWLSPFVDPRATVSLTGSADTSPNPGKQLNDSTQNFIELGVNVGDIIVNTTDNSAGRITERTQQTIKIQAGLSGGTTNQFTENDSYIIPKISGLVGIASTPIILSDATRNFRDLGVREGDLVQNITDSSNGIITAVTANTLTTNLFGGTKNIFSVNDFYRVPRLNGSGVGIYPASLSPLDSGVREGHLSKHEQNEAFRTIFTANWTINGASETICSQLDPSLSGDHVIDLQNNLINGVNLTAAIDQGICEWTIEEEVNCSMFIEPYSITSVIPDTSSTPLCDIAAPFKADTDIVKRTYKFQFIGDVINTKNLNGELARDISTSLALPFALTIQDLDLNNEIVGEAVATTSGTQTGSIVMTDIFYDLADISGLVAAGSSGTQLIDTSKDFILRGVQPGDWVENTNNNTHGRIVSTELSNPDTLAVESKGSTALSFTTGERYKIYHNLPIWFTQNNWHQLYLLTESSAEIPSGTGACTVGTDCLVINGVFPDNDIPAVVISAGSQLASQDRLSAAISEAAYFEDKNITINDDEFTIFSPPKTQNFPPQLNLFNDQIRIVSP